ncbi:replication initiation protein, partial [Staphylococcus warneri]
MTKENHSNYLQNKGSDKFSKTGYSNSRLGVHSVHPQNPKLSFDAMTIVGNLSRDNAQKLSSF